MSSGKMFRGSGINLSFAAESETPGTPGTPASIGSPKGTITVNDGRSSFTVDSFDSAVGAFQEQLADARTGTIGFTTNLMTGDAGYMALDTAYEGNAIGYLKLEADSIDGSVEKVFGWKVSITQRDLTFHSNGNVAEAAITMSIVAAHTWA